MRCAASRLIARKPLTASGMRVFDSRRTVALPSRCKPPLDRAEMGIVAHAAVADDDVRLAADDRRDQCCYVAAVILIVGVGVDDDVGAFGKRAVHPRAEGGGEAAVGAVADDVMDAQPRGDLAGFVPAAVVDDQILDDIHALDRCAEARRSSPADGRLRCSKAFG